MSNNDMDQIIMLREKELQVLYKSEHNFITILATYRENIDELRMKAAYYGPLHVPTSLTNEIRMHEEAISSTDKKLEEIRIRQKEIKNEVDVLKMQLKKPLSNSVFPDGWVVVDSIFLSQYQDQLNSEQVLHFFDGRVPFWEEALSTSIPRRSVVTTITQHISIVRSKKELGLTLLMGPGGEGKSTSLRQIVCDLVAGDPNLNVLWHDVSETPLLLKDLGKITQYKGFWLICSDDADIIAYNVFSFVQELRRRGQKNFHFLLCCRDTDWKAKGADRYPWRDYVQSFLVEEFRGLTKDDAMKIVSAWYRYGNEGMGELAKKSSTIEDAAVILYNEAKLENYPSEGSFLGSMLRTRHGDQLREHVKKLLLRLDERKIFNTSLMDVFGYIVALHARNITILSKPVLAQLVGCQPSQLGPHIIAPLGAETAGERVGPYILARHRAIAEAAVTVLHEEFAFDFEEFFVQLMHAVRRAYAQDPHVLHINEWNRLPSVFFERGEKGVAIRMAHALVQADPGDPVPVVSLARLYRRNNQTAQAINTFRKSFSQVTADRAYFYEWSTSEGNIGNHAISSWLCGISLADGVVGKHDPNREMISLSGLTTSFGELFDKTGDRRFIEGCGAAAQLGLQARPDAKALRNLQNGKSKSSKQGVQDSDIQLALERVITGITLAWSQSETVFPEGVEEDVPADVPAGNQLSFTRLVRLFSHVQR